MHEEDVAAPGSRCGPPRGGRPPAGAPEGCYRSAPPAAVGKFQGNSIERLND